jgi:hypothetical protein
MKFGKNASDYVHRRGPQEMKTLLITFFDIKSIVRFEFILQGQPFNQAYYFDIEYYSL